mmetsp:Transcript_520/g.750  ORF Transcript_520/g.750 Transcript_520/m.750 type:complete len:202 (-) Transcript_520:747-1352(-)
MVRSPRSSNSSLESAPGWDVVSQGAVGMLQSPRSSISSLESDSGWDVVSQDAGGMCTTRGYHAHPSPEQRLKELAGVHVNWRGSSDDLVGLVQNYVFELQAKVENLEGQVQHGTKQTAELRSMVLRLTQEKNDLFSKLGSLEDRPAEARRERRRIERQKLKREQSDLKLQITQQHRGRQPAHNKRMPRATIMSMRPPMKSH